MDYMARARLRENKPRYCMSYSQNFLQGASVFLLQFTFKETLEIQQDLFFLPVLNADHYNRCND